MTNEWRTYKVVLANAVAKSSKTEDGPLAAEAGKSLGELTKDETPEDLLHDDEYIAKSLQQWSTNQHGLYWGSGITVNTLPPGLYRCSYADGIGSCLNRQIISTDELIDLENSDSEEVIREIEKFWAIEHEFIKRKLLHKRGILMMGDPGSGKTSTIQIIIQKMIALGGICLYPSSTSITTDCIQLVRRLEPKRPILLVLEDFETLVYNKGEENGWLSMLDGECQVNNIVFLATTNYIEQIDKRFTDRPSRFDVVKKISMPSYAMRKQYLMTKEPDLSTEELEEWLAESDGLSIAHLKEMLISVKCFGTPLSEVVAKLKLMSERNFHSNTFRDTENTDGKKPQFGFATAK